MSQNTLVTAISALSAALAEAGLSGVTITVGCPGINTVVNTLTVAGDVKETQKDDANVDEPLPEDPKPEDKPKGGRGRSTKQPETPKDEPKPEDKPKEDAPKAGRGRRSTKPPVVEETPEQIETRRLINVDFEDLGSLAETNTQVRDDVAELLARYGLKNIAEITTDRLDDMYEELGPLIDKYFQSTDAAE